MHDTASHAVKSRGQNGARLDDGEMNAVMALLPWRQALALAGGTGAGCLLGGFLGLNMRPSLASFDPGPLLEQALKFIGLGVLVGATTSLISWKHTPGLPGAACSLTLSLLSLWLPAREQVRRENAAAEQWAVWTGMGPLVLVCLLGAYAAAWAADTYVVFRSLPVRPPGKQIDSQIVLTRLLPCCLLTGIAGTLLSLALPLPAVPGFALGFMAGGFLSSFLFRTPSTLWYSASAPLSLTLLSALIFQFPLLEGTLGKLAVVHGGPVSLAGTSAACAILGHWLWRAYANK